MKSEEMKDAERFRWLIKRGLAWRGCYSEPEWLEGEWLYESWGARNQIDEAMKKEELK